jgi:hypothetical protein
MARQRQQLAQGAAASNVTSFPFLRLPQELQDKVFGYLLTCDKHIRHSTNSLLSSEHNTLDTTILLVNKEVYAGALRVLYSSNRICVSADGYSGGRLETQFPTVLLHHLRNVTLNYTLMGESQASHFHALTSWLGRMSNLRRLRLEIEESDPRFRPYGQFQDQAYTMYMYKPLDNQDVDYLRLSVMPLLALEIRLRQLKITWPMSNGQGMEKFRGLLQYLEAMVEGKKMLAG